MKTLFCCFIILVVSACHDSRSSDVYEAINNQNIDRLELLLATPSQINLQYYDGWTPLTIAASKGKSRVVKNLIERGADVNLLESGGNSAMFWAAHSGNLRTLELILGAGADPCLKKGTKHTAKQIAIVKGNIEVVNLLPDCEV